MRRRLAIARRWPWYPFLIGIFPLLTLYSANVDKVSLDELWLPLGLVLTVTLVLLLLLWAPIRNVHRAAILAAAIVSLAMTFRHWQDAIAWFAPPRNPQDSVGVQALMLQALAMVWVIYAVWRVRDPLIWTRRLNLLAAILLIGPVLTCVWRLEKNWQATTVAVATSQAKERILFKPAVTDRSQYPDIYFIALDAYARADVLADLYHYNDQPFLQHLRDKGFYIADASTSNYCFTEASFTSILNLRYLDELSGNPSTSMAPLVPLLHNNAAVATLREMGYRWVAFESAWAALCFPEADVYLHPPPIRQISEFQQLVLDSTIVPEVFDVRDHFDETGRHNESLDYYQAKRWKIEYEFAHLGETAKIPGPKFVFCHIFAPHPAFVFAADGSDPGPSHYGLLGTDPCIDTTMSAEQYREYYRDQLIYANRQITTAIDQILANSPRPPVIVLIGDHGARSGTVPFSAAQTDLHECMSNLTAVLLPGKANAGLYPGITPVNLFRVVFNDYFQANLPLLPDRAYFSDPTRYAFVDVSGQVRPAVASVSSPPVDAPAQPRLN